MKAGNGSAQWADYPGEHNRHSHIRNEADAGPQSRMHGWYVRSKYHRKRMRIFDDGANQDDSCMGPLRLHERRSLVAIAGLSITQGLFLPSVLPLNSLLTADTAMSGCSAIPSWEAHTRRALR